MRDRKLSREEALEEYLVYQIRLYDYLHMFQIALQIKDGEYKPQNPLGHGTTEFFESVRSSCYGLFASLMDPQNHALDVFDVWRVLFPDKEEKIIATWKTIEPHLPLVRDYRNEVAFHANKSLRRYFEVRQNFRRQASDLVRAMQSFWDLAADLIRYQSTALPDFREEIDPVLKKALPDLRGEELEQLKDYYIQNRPAGAAGQETKEPT